MKPTKEILDEAESERKFPEYQPEMRTVKKDLIYSAVESIQNGLEYAREYSLFLDNILGRTNKTWAEKMERDMKKMENVLAELKRTSERKIENDQNADDGLD